jgi:predicted nucleic acid-binding protein
MKVFDASSLIHAWDNYPIRHFPGLWNWISIEAEERRIATPIVAFEEVEHKTPECGDWLKKNNLVILPITNRITEHAIKIKNLLGIIGDSYRVNGVGENDIFIIATAIEHQSILVSEEKRQTILPVDSAKRKIPAVCAMEGISIECISFIEFIKRSNEIFH